MKYIVYGEHQVMTGDAVATAVIRYAAALAQSRTADIVAVPTNDRDGFATSVELLLGPASQLMVENAPDDELEVEAPDFVADLARRAAAVGAGQRPDSLRPTTTDPGADFA